MYQLPSLDPVPPSNNKCRPILTQYHHVSTSLAFYWPSTIIYQPVPLHTTKYQPIPTYTVVAWELQTSAQFTLGLVLIHNTLINVQMRIICRLTFHISNPIYDITWIWFKSTNGLLETSPSFAVREAICALFCDKWVYPDLSQQE